MRLNVFTSRRSRWPRPRRGLRHRGYRRRGPDHHRYGPPVPVRTPRRPRRPQRGQLLGRPGPPHHLRHPIERAKAGRRRHELRRPATSNNHRPSQSDHVAGRTECTLHPDSPTHALPVPGGLPPVHLWTPPAIAGAGGAHRWTAGPGPGPWTAQRRRGSSVAAYAAARPDHRPSQSDHATGRFARVLGGDMTQHAGSHPPARIQRNPATACLHEQMVVISPSML